MQKNAEIKAKKELCFDAPCLELSLNTNRVWALPCSLVTSFDAPCLELSLNSKDGVEIYSFSLLFRCSLFGAFFKLATDNFILLAGVLRFDAPCLELSLNILGFFRCDKNSLAGFDAPCLELSLNITRNWLYLTRNICVSMLLVWSFL